VPYEQFLGILQNVGTAALTAGKINAFLTLDPPAGSRLRTRRTSSDGVKVIRVEATRRGFYGNSMREPGTVFNLKIRDGEKFPSWCKLFDEGDRRRQSRKRKRKKR
jgi:hypothetical protein